MQIFVGQFQTQVYEYYLLSEKKQAAEASKQIFSMPLAVKQEIFYIYHKRKANPRPFLSPDKFHFELTSWVQIRSSIMDFISIKFYTRLPAAIFFLSDLDTDHLQFSLLFFTLLIDSSIHLTKRGTFFGQTWKLKS